MTTSDRQVQLDLDYASDLLHLLETLDDILRYAGSDMLDDITQRHHEHMTAGLLCALQLHSSLLHHAITTQNGLPYPYDY